MSSSGWLASTESPTATSAPRVGPPDAELDAGLVERVAAGEVTHEDVMARLADRMRERR